MKLTILVLFLLVNYGCGAKKLAVQNADTLITRQINKKLPLYSAQEEQLSKDVDALLNQSKPLAQDIIPVIDDLDPKSPEKLGVQYEKLENFYKTLATKFTDMISKYLAKLDKKQQKDLFETLDDENREILKKENGERLEAIEGRFKMLLGSITSEQKQLIKDYEDYFRQRSKERLARRTQLHEKFRAIYDSDTSESSKHRSFQEAFMTYQKDALEGNKNLEMLKKIVPTLTTNQREFFRKEAQEVKDLLRYFNSIDY